jgi:helix-turn-helix protein
MRRGKLGRFLVSLRRARGQQQRTVAKQLGLPLDIYRACESGQWRPSEDDLRQWITDLQIGEANAGALCLGWVLWQDYSV